jgi:hypothetical protein
MVGDRFANPENAPKVGAWNPPASLGLAGIFSAQKF